MTLTKSQKLELQKLKAKASIAQLQLDELYKKAMQITGEQEDGYTFDFIYNDGFIKDVDDLIEKLSKR